jgi:hypothetical protein
MGNKPYKLPQKTICSYEPALKNHFGLTPYETSMLNYTFSQYTGRERRMYYSQFKKLYKRLNSELSAYELGIAAPIAFSAADSNCDGTISFDEFVDAYTLFKATPCSLRAFNSGLILY